MHGWKPRKVVGWLFFFMFPKVLAFLQYPLHGLGAFFRFNYGDVLRIKKIPDAPMVPYGISIHLHENPQNYPVL